MHGLTEGATRDVLNELGPDGRGRAVCELLRRLGVALPDDVRDGLTFAVACPFHQETHGTALVVMPDAGAVECKGACARTWGLFDLAVAAGLAATRADAADVIRRGFLGRLHDPAKAADATNGNGRAKATDCAAWHARTREGLDWTKLGPADPRLALVLAAGYSPRALEELRGGFAPARRKGDEEFPPALVFAVRDADGRVAAVKLRALAPAADGVKSRSVGPTGSGVLGREQLDEKADAVAVVAAGEKDMAHGLGAAPVFAWTSLAAGEGGTLGPLVALYTGRQVVILYDKDAAGRAGAEKLARELLGAAASVAVAEISDDVLDGTKAEKDVADIVRKFGTAAGDVLRRIIAEARPFVAAAAIRPRIVVRAMLGAVVDEAEAALAALSAVNLYARAGLLVRVTRAAKRRRGLDRGAGAPVIEPVVSAYVRELLDQAAKFVIVKDTADGPVERAALPPSWCVETLLARGSWALPELSGIVECPTLRPDGSLLDVPGHDEASGLLYEPSGSFPPVATSPTAEDVRAAVAVLREPFAQFPFVADCDRAAAVGTILTAVARFSIDGPAPLHAWRATTPGSGKTLAVDVAAIVATGRPAARMTVGKNDEETRKLVLSIGLEGAGVVLLDNVEGALGSAALAAALTSTTFRDRLLGVSKLVTVSLRGVTWFATGNGLAFRGDLGRRVVPIDLDAKAEHPEDRIGFRHPDLLAFVRAERPRLVVAALTILRAFRVAGRPSHGLARVGSFEAWDDAIRGACIWAEIGDPVAGRQRIRDEGDQDLDALRAALDTWAIVFGKGSETAAAAVREATRPAHETEPHDYSRDRAELRGALAELAGCSVEKVSARNLGYALRRVRGRLVDGRAFDHAVGETHGAVRWRVVVSGGDGGHGGDVPSPSPSAQAADAGRKS